MTEEIEPVPWFNDPRFEKPGRREREAAATPSDTPAATSPETPADTYAAGGLDLARALDQADPLRHFRERFNIPTQADGSPVHYFCGNSLGLQPRAARMFVEQELEDWATLAVDAHFHGRTPWYSYHEVFREIGARLVGAQPGEVVMMNSLTVNLHLMMVSFFRPTTDRFRILMEAPAFPSDTYAITSHLRARGLDPADALRIIQPREGEHTLRTEDIEAHLEREGDSIALVLFAGVNFLTGQAMDMPRITKAAQARGCLVGFDLAHAAGNLELHLHNWNVDFACWCSYKYLNAGPGAIAGCFVHEQHGRHGSNPALERFAGWWGNDPDTRFRMHLEPEFIPRPGADGWQLSNPPILAMAPLRASLALFDEAGMTMLRAKSRHLTGYLEALLAERMPQHCEVLTPHDPAARGCQLSLRLHDRPRERREALQQRGILCDFREPDILRIAPVPLYNTFEDVWTFTDALASLDA